MCQRGNRIIISFVIGTWVAVVGVLGYSSDAAAQGLIFGTVTSSDQGHPADSDLSWFGFLDNTDEEIRTDINVGADYDGLNWFDDFQNYTTEAAGNPYDFVYVDTVRVERFRLEGTIPANSFQEENIILTAGSVPSSPANLQAVVQSPTEIMLLWDAVAGLRYHVYRRDAGNNGVYRRIDDPSGNLANAGVAGPSYADATSDGSSQYVYLLIAEDSAGFYSAHSEPIMVDAAGPGCMCPCQADINCDGFRANDDLNFLIQVVFFNAAAIQDSGCPMVRTDLDCDGLSTSVDMNLMISLLFFNGPPPCNPCIP